MFKFVVEEASFTPPRPGEDLYTCSLTGKLVEGNINVGLSIGVDFGEGVRSHVVTFLRSADEEGNWQPTRMAKPGPLIVDVKVTPAAYPVASEHPPGAGVELTAASPF